jgi:uncharacterized protein YuzE
MKIKYFQDTDTLHIELFPAQIGETRNPNEKTLLDLDAEGQLCAIAIKRTSSRIDLYSLMGLPGGVHGLLNLTVAEQEWLDEYRRQLAERFPGLVEGMFIYGMYAHGYSRGYKDLDIEMNLLVLICEGDREMKDEIRDLRIDADYRVSSTFAESEAHDACQRAQVFLDRIRPLLVGAVSVDET